MNLCMVTHCFLLQVDHLLTLLVITLAGLPVSKLNTDEMALVLQRHGEETRTGKRQVQAENLMLSNDTVNVCGGIASLIDEQVWSIDGMILTGLNGSTVLGDNPHNVSSSTTKSMWAGLGSNPGLHGERLVTSCPSHGMAQEKSVEYSIM
jgi:hypothetical protein